MIKTIYTFEDKYGFRSTEAFLTYRAANDYARANDLWIVSWKEV